MWAYRRISRRGFKKRNITFSTSGSYDTSLSNDTAARSRNTCKRRKYDCCKDVIVTRMCFEKVFY